MGFWNFFVGKTGELSEQRDDVLLQGRMFRKRRGPKGKRAVFVRASWAKTKAPCSKCVFQIRRGKPCSACRQVKLVPVEADEHLSDVLKSMVNNVLRTSGHTPAAPTPKHGGEKRFKPIHYGKILRISGDGVDIRIDSTEPRIVVQFGLHGTSLVQIETVRGESSYYKADAHVIRSVFRAFFVRAQRRLLKVVNRELAKAPRPINFTVIPHSGTPEDDNSWC